MRNFLLKWVEKSAASAASACLILAFFQILRILLHLRAGKADFCGQKPGFLAWEGKHGKFLFASTALDPDREVESAMRTGLHAAISGIAGIACRRRG